MTELRALFGTTSAVELSTCVSATKRSRTSASQATEFVSSFVEIRPTKAQRHGVSSKADAAPANTANAADSA